MAEAVDGIKVDGLRSWLAKAVVKRSLGEDGGVVIPFKNVVKVAKLPPDRQLALYEQLLKEVPDPSRAEPAKIRRAFNEALKEEAGELSAAIVETRLREAKGMGLVGFAESLIAES